MSRTFLTCLVALGLAQSTLAAPTSVRNLDKEHVAGQLIVKFHEGLTPAQMEMTLKGFEGRKVREFRASKAQLVSFSASTGDDSLALIGQKLLADPRVKYVEANTILHADRMPNDPQFNQLYGLHNEGTDGGKAGADIDAPQAWDVTTGSRNVLVGVIDTGVDYTHPDIMPNYWSNPGETGVAADGTDKISNGVDDDANGFIDDWRGWDFANNDNDPLDDNNHGTHVAGTIGGQGDDGVGVVGVNWNVSIVGLKFLTGAGSGTLEGAVMAIEYGTKLGVTLTSNSWGGGGYSETMEAAIREAGEQGVLFIAAAGNDGTDNDVDPHFPSSYDLDNVISVAATDRNDAIADFSCFGLNSVDLGAPGVDIVSSIPGNKYDKYSGTSMATPHVSGAAALVKAAYPDATAAQIKARLLNTADPVDSLAGKTVTGGRLNVASALENDAVAPNAATSLVMTEARTTSVVFEWRAAGDDGDIGTARRYEVRYSEAQITSEDEWAAAAKAKVQIQDADVNGAVSATVSGLAFNSSGFIAVKAIDNVGNVGPLSDSAAFGVIQVRKVYEDTTDTLEGVTADAPWGLEDLDTGKVFSDSPTGQYVENLDISLTLADVTLNSPLATLVIDSSWELEAGYDFASVEISLDAGATWILLDEVSGVSGGMKQSLYDLSPVLGEALTFKLRFRLKTDYSINYDGYKVGNVQIFAPARR